MLVWEIGTPTRARSLPWPTFEGDQRARDRQCFQGGGFAQVRIVLSGRRRQRRRIVPALGNYFHF
jgi:hypothetical protein